MDGPGSRLAARFRKAVQDRADAKREAAEAAKRAREEAQRARSALLTDLEALAGEIGYVTVSRDREGITLRFGERYLFFGPEGEDDRVRIEFEGMGDEAHHLHRQPELGHRWVHVRRRRFREDRLPLFDAGLEELLVRGLGLPRPGEEGAEPADSGRGKRL